MTGPAGFFRKRPWRRAALWLCFLGPFFFITYGLANAYTAALFHVKHFVFSWERNIPFVPWTVIPYWSIDFFYGLSLFLWTSRKRLDRHALRLVAATLICVSGFFIFPLQFSFDRPEIEQPFFRLLFDLLESFDKPYNQAPSLHICLLIIIWDALRRNIPKRMLPLVHTWAALVAVSVFTTYQHHIIDGISAVPAAILCCYLIPLDGVTLWGGLRKRGRSWVPGDAARARRLGGRYALAAGIFSIGAGLGGILASGWWSALLWPALCFALVAAGYLGFGPGVFQKTPGLGPDAGTRPFAARILLAPYEYGARAYRRKYTVKLPKVAEVAPGIWLGAYPRALPLPECGVLDLTSEYPRPKVCGKGGYACVPMLDLLPPDKRELEEALGYLDELLRKGPVLVNCALGMTRSALVVACALTRKGVCADLGEALRLIESVRPCIVVSEKALAAAESFMADKRPGN